MIREKVYGLPTYAKSQAPICPGCSHGVVGRLIAEVIEELGIGGKVVHVAGVGCGTMIGLENLQFDVVVGTHGTAPAIATGVKRALGGKPIVFTYQGDGDCAAIGAGALLNAASRGENITVIMGNNLNYGMTGGQLAPTTLIGQETTTTPGGRSTTLHGYPLRTAETMVPIEGVMYSARGSVHNPANIQRTKKYLKAAFQKQMDGAGFSFVEVLVACPVNWHLTPVEALKRIEREAIPVFPLGELKNVNKTQAV